MKRFRKNLFFLFCLLFSASSYAAQSFDGYIVKMKGNQKLDKSLFNKSRQLNTNSGHFYVVEGNQRSLDLLKSNDSVEYVEPNYIITLDTEGHGNVTLDEKSLADSKFTQQWGLKNTGKNSGSWWSPGKKGEDVNAEKAWTLTRGKRKIVVAVIDTGLDYTHSDLKANLWTNKAELNGEEGVDDDGNGYVDDIHGYDFANKDGDPMDGHGHGTHCAGVIGAVHNRAGIAGVMANAQIMGIKFLTDRGSGTTADAIESINYATKAGVDVMSNSWGGGGRSEALKEAIEEANAAGIVFVAAAGNSRNDNDSKPSYPASYKVDNVISVGAMDGKGKKASFSNYGKTSVHVFAPGVNILSTVQNDGYKKMSGTSMACPHVSGAVGLLLSSEEGLSPKQVRDRIISTSVDNGNLADYAVSGRMDSYQMLR